MDSDKAKQQYVKPVVEIIEFETEDVISTSGDETEGVRSSSNALSLFKTW